MTGQTQATSIDGLLDQLQKSKEFYVRKVAADRLGELAKGNEQVLGALRNVAQSDANKSVRDAAKSSLRKLGEKFEEVGTSLTNSDAIWIGMQAGIILYLILAFIIFALVSAGIIAFDWFEYFYVPIFVFTLLGWSAIPGGVAGALISKNWKKSRKAVWIGAPIGAVFGMLILGLLNGSIIRIFTSGLYVYPK